MNELFKDFETLTVSEQETIVRMAGRRGIPVPPEVQKIIDMRTIGSMQADMVAAVSEAPVDVVDQSVVAELMRLGEAVPVWQPTVDTSVSQETVPVDEPPHRPKTTALGKLHQEAESRDLHRGLVVEFEEPLREGDEMTITSVKPIEAPTTKVTATVEEESVVLDDKEPAEHILSALSLSEHIVGEDSVVQWERNPVRDGGGGASVKLPAVSKKTIESVLNSLREKGVRPEDVLAEAADALEHGSTLMLENSQLGKIDGDFTNDVEYRGRKLNPGEVRLATAAVGVITGRTGVELAMRRRNRGSSNHVACWGSGFWLTFVPASDSDIYEIHQQMTAKMSEFGNETYGAAFERMSGLLQETLLEFALAHLDTTSLTPELSDPATIRRLLSKLDIPTVLAGFAATLYSNGFNYSRRCIADLTKCSHQVTGLMNIMEMLQVDRSRLTEPMLRHMSERRHGSHNQESLDAYRAELAKSAPSNRVVVSQGTEKEMIINFRVASADEFFRESNEWVSEVGRTVLKLTTEATNKEARYKMYQDAMMMSYLRNYGSWIQSIEFDQAIIEDRATIEDVLSRLSNDNELIEALVKGKNDFQNASTISIVGIPTYTCPACGKKQPGSVTEGPRSNFIALEVVELFFDLVNLRFLKALQVVS